jgi:hypothetical protein
MQTNPIIYEPLKNASRIKVYIPYELKELRTVFKKINTTFWHPTQKLWSIVNTEENFVLLKKILPNYKLKSTLMPTPIKKSTLDKYGIDQLFLLEKALVLKQYSASTINSYKNMFAVFLTKFPKKELATITKEEIEGFVYELLIKNKISESYQNQLINAIKAYYEHALGKPREYYEIMRPKKAVTVSVL